MSLDLGQVFAWLCVASSQLSSARPCTNFAVLVHSRLSLPVLCQAKTGNRADTNDEAARTICLVTYLHYEPVGKWYLFDTPVFVCTVCMYVCARVQS
jgi:hypothetical protein